jgi:hypothetical protein
LEGSCRGHEKPVGIASITIENRTEHLPNASRVTVMPTSSLKGTLFAKITHALLNFISGICFLPYSQHKQSHTPHEQGSVPATDVQNEENSTSLDCVLDAIRKVSQVTEGIWGVGVKLSAALGMCSHLHITRFHSSKKNLTI